MKKNFNKGFTLIELLVVIAIIGVLSSVVLASLNTARNKGTDAAIHANLANVRPQAEIFYDANSSSYTGVCASGTGTIYAGVQAASVAAGTGSTVVVNGASQTTSTANCNASATAWAASVKLKNGALYACVDSTGVAKDTTALLTGIVACP